MLYKFKAILVDGSEIESRIKLNKDWETYRDAWIRASRWFSEIGEIKQMILLEVEQ